MYDKGSLACVPAQHPSRPKRSTSTLVIQEAPRTKRAKQICKPVQSNANLEQEPRQTNTEAKPSIHVNTGRNPNQRDQTSVLPQQPSSRKRCADPLVQETEVINKWVKVHNGPIFQKRAKPVFNRSHCPDSRARGSVSDLALNQNQTRNPSEPLPEQLPRHGIPGLTQVQGSGITMFHNAATLPVAFSSENSSAGVTCTAPPAR